MLRLFWRWYEKHYKVNVLVAAFLFGLQAFHLYWLATHIVALEFLGRSFFSFPTEFSWLYALVDYTEIPAFLSVSLLYIHQIQKGRQIAKSWLYLVFLNSQWLHLFWITDEVVIESLTGVTPVVIPRLVAFIAIAIDYLELPVMVETGAKALRAITQR